MSVIVARRLLPRHNVALARLGLVKKEDAKIESYVTRKALDGLYLMIAEEEKAIRQNPVAAAGGLAKKVFGTLGGS